MKLIWIDLETTGLTPLNNEILEIAAFESDIKSPFDVTQIYERVLFFPFIASTETYGCVSDYVRMMHTQNGLWAECAQAHASVKQVDAELATLIEDVENTDDKPVLAGSTIHFDRSFMRVHMPKTEAKFSHRHYDVSSIKLFCQSLGMPLFPKGNAHRAKADVLESVAHAEACAKWLQDKTDYFPG